jgi:hypothetical protein
MKFMSIKTFVIFLAVSILLLFSKSVFGKYDLSWYTFEGGGGRCSGGQYMLTGSIGQPDADWCREAQYEVLGGFLPGEPICIVNFRDFASFALHWLDAPCNVGNNWCGGADLDQLGDVGAEDANLFFEEWLCNCPAGWLLK